MRSCVARLCRTAMDGADIKRVVSLLYAADAWRFAGEVAIIDRMSLLRFVAVVALALWVGGLVALGVAAPTLFQVLEQHAPNGRELAGAAFGDVFARFQHVAWGLGTTLLASIGARAAVTIAATSAVTATEHGPRSTANALVSAANREPISRGPWP